MLITKISILDVMKKSHSNSMNQVSQNIASYVMDTDPFNVDKLVDMIQLGNSNCQIEKAADILENYLMASDDNTLLDAYFEIINSYDKMFGFLKLFGYTVDEFKQEIMNKVNEQKQVISSKQDNIEDVQLDS